MKALALVTLAAMISLASAAPRAADGSLAPFVAEYEVRYGNLTVGTSRTELARGAEPGSWTIESQSNARGFARIIASGTLSQQSRFYADATNLRPHSYRFDDGTNRTGHDVTLEFDWRSGRVTGVAEDQQVNVAVEPGLQDAASIQALVTLRLRAGVDPGTIAMIEKDRIKRYRYTLFRRERLITAIGEYDTVVYRSTRDGSSRETLSWYAPTLGYALLRAEQHRDGDRTFQTRIRSYQPGG
ncbi:MAG: DUF3108 domain-containing protein [Steroidobacteraceae bacterium]